MQTKEVYQYDANHIYVGTAIAYENPVNPGTFLIPHGCTDVVPPDNVPANSVIRWDESAWEIIYNICPPSEGGLFDTRNTNVNLQLFLSNTDWKVLRHIRELALNQPTSLTHEQYIELEQARADAASKIVNNPALKGEACMN